MDDEALYAKILEGVEYMRDVAAEVTIEWSAADAEVWADDRLPSPPPRPAPSTS
jgi:hypothetical protein